MKEARNITIKDFEKNDHAMAVYNAIKYNIRDSFFVTGNAGTGKSALIEVLRKALGEKVKVLAPTGVAANHVNGKTIHSYLHLPPTGLYFKDSYEVMSLTFGKNRKAEIDNLELIIIDEISMVSSAMLDCIDYAFRRATQLDIPFGNIGVLFVGDGLQLPPIIRKEDKKLLYSRYKSEYFFDSDIFKELDPVKIELEASYRQKDIKFMQLLDEVRIGQTKGIIDELNKQCYDADKLNAVRSGLYDGIIISPHNDIVNGVNERHLNTLPGEASVFNAIIEGSFRISCVAEEELKLKVGAQVMFLKNDYRIHQKRYVNGTLAIVTEINEESILVKLKNGDVVNVVREAWDNYKMLGGLLTRIGSFKQFPLKLAWAITVHKCQGLTFDKVHFDFKNVFAPSQVYVALSRCRSISGLSFSRRINERDIFISQAMKEFYDSIHSEREENKFLKLLELIEIERQSIQSGVHC